MTQEFELIDFDFIELNKLMKLLGLVATGGEANVRITNQEVKVNNVIEIQKRKKLRPGDVVSFETYQISIK
ncbi:MAG: RNA-binding S4 domain-containing protein [Cytophagaceae bacterium]|nr:RNA-binding S4 domain-containing protein [Cytophagaceae bacterium]